MSDYVRIQLDRVVAIYGQVRTIFSMQAVLRLVCGCECGNLDLTDTSLVRRGASHGRQAKQ